MTSEEEKKASIKSEELKNNAIKAEKAEKAERDEVLTEALEESFPASDPIPTLRTTKSGF